MFSGLQIALALAALPSAGATALAFFGQFHWLIDLLAHFRLQYTGVLLLTSLAAIGARFWRWLALWMVALIANLTVIAPLLLTPATTVPDDGPTLRIVHLNVNKDHRDPARLAQWIDGQQADVIFLQEYAPSLHELLQRTLRRYRIVAAEPRRDTRGIAALTPINPTLAIRDWRVFRLVPQIDRPMIEAVASLGARDVALLSLHASQPFQAPALRAELLAAAQWSRQQAQRGRPSLVIGDFNVTAWSTYYRELVDQGDFANSQHGFALWPTWHAGLPLVMRIPIDQCLHSRDLATVARQVGPDVGSDHLPLLVNLRLRSSHARPPE